MNPCSEGEKGKLKVKRQLINVQGVVELGNYHLANSRNNKTSEKV